MTEPANVIKVQFGSSARSAGSRAHRVPTQRSSGDGDETQSPDNPLPLPLAALDDQDPDVALADQWRGDQDTEPGGEVLCW
jgi:hypothetical protein